MPSQDHPTFYHIGQKLENHEGRLTAIETLIKRGWQGARWGFLIILWSTALLINASPSFWADLARHVAAAVLSR